MKIFLVGISCVGKSTIGKQLAEEIEYAFFDLDNEIENFFNEPIARIKSHFITDNSYREKASIVLKKIIEENLDNNFIVALPPSGLRDWFYKEIKKTDSIVIAINDSPENILKRITFYDDDSNLIEKKLTEKEKKYYLKEIKKDITFFKKYYKKANYQIDITGLDISDSVRKFKELLDSME